MKNFYTKLSLKKFLELEGELVPGIEMLILEFHPCIFLSKRMKWYYYDRDDKTKRIKTMHYKVKTTNDSLYKKDKIVECLVTELNINVKVKAI